MIAIAAAMIAVDIPNRASAQGDDETAGRIVARLLDDGRVEFGWQPTDGERVLPRQRYFPTNATVDRWLRSSPVEIGGVEIGRINARLLDNGRIEFGFTPTDGERILTRARYFPTDAQVNRWLRSTEITLSLAEDAPGFTAVSAGGGHTCGLRNTGEIACWGDNAYGRSSPPVGIFTAVSAGLGHSCGLRENGAIECWGNNESGETDAPAGTFTAVSAGWHYSCGLRTSGVIECWGNNETPQVGEEGQVEWVHGGQSDAPTGSFTAVSAYTVHTCGLRESGEIACWGDNRIGQVDAPEGSFIAVSTGAWHSCGLRDDGAITCWGSNGSGESDAPKSSFIAVNTGYAHSCGLRDDGAIICWGSNESGESDAPESSFTAISAGSGHTCGLRTNGSIECWGRNDEGQTDAPAP